MTAISEAPTLDARCAEELRIMRQRLKSEAKRAQPAKDNFGVERIQSMIEDIRAEAVKAREAERAVKKAETDDEEADGTKGFPAVAAVDSDSDMVDDNGANLTFEEEEKEREEEDEAGDEDEADGEDDDEEKSDDGDAWGLSEEEDSTGTESSGYEDDTV